MSSNGATTTTTTSAGGGGGGGGKIGILIVGLGGNNGVTLAAGLIANTKKLVWESTSAGRVGAPNWYGCITQLPRRGGGVGYKDSYDLADASEAVVGGWDIRPTKLGDALYDCRVLDYDLVRQVRDDMNSMDVMPGVYDASFLGESQYDTATNIVPDDAASTFLEKVEHIRRDIRSFVANNDVTGHTTVIWSASVERPADVDFRTAEDVLDAVYNKGREDCDISPSIMYAVASALEGCSFINGGSQNTLSDGLYQLYDVVTRASKGTTALCPTLSKFSHVSVAPAYLLGTDFKAGQTKFKTSAVEYIRALGLKPRVIASSNHLGNNDMLNLTSKKTIDAKMRVKSDIFGPWEEDDLDHQVRVMYTRMMGDEKRDVVEYTSLGFLHCPHTMLTYTRCMDSVLCVPLMIDGAVWCDYFARHESSPSTVAAATSYLFKVPEGGAKGMDPGFQKQMNQLDRALLETKKSAAAGTTVAGGANIEDFLARGVREGILTEAQVAALMSMTKK